MASFIAAESLTAKPSTIGRRVAAIRYAHKLAGLDTPTDAEGVKATMRGICRTFGSAWVKKAPAIAARMLSMVATAPDRLSDLQWQHMPNVRYWVNSGRRLLAASISPFDPELT